MRVSLALSGAFVPTSGQSFVLIDNDGVDAVSGTFAGLAQGATLVFNGVNLTIDYSGGDGNDVVLGVVPNPSVSIAVSPASVLEDGATTLSFTVTRSPSLPTATTVNISTGGTATSGLDYTGAVATVVILANATTATITIDPTPDSTIEPDETVILTVEPGSGYTVGSPSSATGTIQNDDADFTVTTTANSIVVTDSSSNGSTLQASEPSANNLRFDAAGRTFSVNGGAPISGNSGNLALAGITSISVNATGGVSVASGASFNIGASTYASASSITLAGGTLNTTGTTAVVNAPIVLSADSDVAGTMTLGGAISGNFTLRTFGSGNYRFASTASTFARLQITSGTVLLAGNNTLPPQIDIFNSSSFDLNGFSQTVDFYASSGSTLNTGVAANLSIGMAGSASSFGSANYTGQISGPINLTIAAGADQTLGSNSSSYTGTTNVLGTLRITGINALGATGAGNGTTVAATGVLDFRNVGYAGSESLTVNGGTLTTGTGVSSFPGSIVLNTSSAIFSVVGSSTLTLGGVISGSQGFDKTDGGTLVLTQANTFNGPIVSSLGNLRLIGSTAVSSAVTINNGTLSGTGTIGGPLSMSDGNLSPGVAATTGILHTANVVLAPAAINVLLDITGPTLGSEYDQLDVNGTIDLGSANLLVGGSFVPSIGQSFTVIDNDGSDAVTGTFAGLPEGATRVFNGVPLVISYVGGDGNDVETILRERAAGLFRNFSSLYAFGAFCNAIYLI